MKSCDMHAKTLSGELHKKKPSVSVIVPGYNEEKIIATSLARIHDYLQSIEGEYEWEMIVVNDGSTDETGEIAESFARARKKVRVLHHFTNFNVGQALRYAFRQSSSDYIVTMDMDLSYSTEHIGRLLKTIIKEKAKIVIASPYMKGGRTANVPLVRRWLSRFANRFLSYAARGKLATLTSMVRAYDRRFLCSLSLKSLDISISAEIVYKAMLMHARILEIPAVLDWNPNGDSQLKRKSSIRIRRSLVAYLFSGFIFRPFMFFFVPALALSFVSIFSFYWILAHTFHQMEVLQLAFGSLSVRVSAAVSQAFEQAPHTFIIGGVSLMLSVQMISLGIIALQSKRYFEELFHLGIEINETYRSLSGKIIRKMDGDLSVKAERENL
jgi:glycosyltransferase involved in cell wall biosynthesis